VEDTLIEFKNVTKRFGHKTILDSVNLQILDGHVTTIIGKSGTGKSVLLKHIIGLLAPTEGTILFRGKSIRGMNRNEFDAFRKQFSYCFQSNALFDSLTVAGNISLPLQQTTKMGKREIEEKVCERMDQLEVSDVHDKYPSELSGGMQKRVALARALITDPKIVLFDEPTTGQDPIRKNAILRMIAQNQKRFGFTTIMISHEIPDVFFISNRILILYDGKIIFQGTYQDLDELRHPMVDEYIKSLKGFEAEFLGPDLESGFFRNTAWGFTTSRKTDATAVALFELKGLAELSKQLGEKQADEIVRSLEEMVNGFFGDVGISNRLTQNEIATILSNTDVGTAETMVAGFTKELQSHGLGAARADVKEGPAGDSVGLSVHAGLVAMETGEDIQAFAGRARSRKKEIARFWVPV